MSEPPSSATPRLRVVPGPEERLAEAPIQEETGSARGAAALSGRPTSTPFLEQFGPSARGRLLTFALVTLGIAVAVVSTVMVGLDGWDIDPRWLLAVPVIVLVAQFPVVTDQGDGGVEIGFDSAVLILLICSLDPSSALALWSLGVLGVLASQLLAHRRWGSVLFNAGLAITAGAIATVVLEVIAGSSLTEPRELVAVLAAATAYFTADFVISAVSVALDDGGSGPGAIARPATLVAISCFVPFDALGYLGAVLLRVAPWWMMLLLVAPLATLLIAARAISRGRENSRRLQVLLDAAVNYQTLSEPRQVLDSLLEDATRLLRVSDVTLRHDAPGPAEIGAQVRGVEETTWISAPANRRARSDPEADQRAIAALAAVSAAAFNRLALTEDLVHLARFDSLTDLPNRAVFLDRLNYTLMLARRRKTQVALLFVDLDGFKPVNDRFGHAAGDAVLIEVARRLQAAVRSTDTVARLGGDEFAVLFEEADMDVVTAACQRILATLAEGVDIGQHLVYVSASIGISFGSAQQHADEVLRNGDLAMYEAKARGKSRFVCYEPRMLASRLDRLELVEALGEAVGAGELTVAYQPVCEAATGRIVGAEALARWRYQNVDISPEFFIQIAEESGMIVALGAAMLEKVVEDAAAIAAAGGDGLNLAVNVSPTQLSDPAFVDHVRAAVVSMGAANRLILEITEREEIKQDPTVIAHMRTITDLGVTFAIDDFGVGFSSINYLREVPARIVKIDATLSQNVDQDDQARELLRSIAMMSQALGLDVVVEGVERTSQLDIIRADVDGVFVQGYLLHRPMPLEDLLSTLRDETGPGVATLRPSAPVAPTLPPGVTALNPGRSAPPARR